MIEFDRDYNCCQIINKPKANPKVRIEGYIGFPEEWQFDPDYADKVIATKEKMRNEIESISKIKSKEVDVEIDSFGGDVNHGTAMYRALMSLKPTGTKINVVYTGWSASAATIIGAAGDTRTAPSNLQLLYHQSSSFSWGGSETMRNTADTLENVNNQIVDIYMNSGAKDRQDIIDLMAIENGDGKWITPEDALEYGLITNVTQEFRAAAVKTENFKLYNLPKIKDYNMDTSESKGLFKQFMSWLDGEKEKEAAIDNSVFDEKVLELQNSFKAIVDENETLTSDKETFENKVEEITAERDLAITEKANEVTAREAAEANELSIKNEYIEYAKEKLDRAKCVDLGVDDFDFMNVKVTEDTKRAQKVLNKKKVSIKNAD